MRSASAGLSVALVSVALSGCLPLPHWRYDAPEVHGLVLKSGVPVADAEVHLSSEFSKTTRAVRTDGEGQFNLGPLRRPELIQYLVGDPLYSYTLRIRADGMEYRGIVGSRIGYPPRNLEIICDLSGPLTNADNPEYSAYCEPLCDDTRP